MTIGFLINSCEPFYRGGYERRTWSFAQELSRQGHDVRIYTSCPADEVVSGVSFVRLTSCRPYFNRRGVRNGYADVLFAVAVFKLLWKVRQRELDILDVCATPFLHLPVVRLVATLKKIPLVLTCHEALLSGLKDYVRERGHGPDFPGAILARGLEWVYRLGMGLMPDRLAVSARTKRALEEEGFPAREVIEFGLEREAFGEPEISAQAEPARFVSCGRLTPIKNVGAAIDALLKLRDEGKKFHFEIIGDGAQRAGLEEKVASAGAGEMILFHGEVSETLKREILARSEVFILSSPREGFSIATLEAMAQGCAAVVVADPRQANGALDFVRDEIEGLHALPASEGLIPPLRKLIDDPELRLKLRKGARLGAESYRLEEQARRLGAAYAEITGR